VLGSGAVGQGERTERANVHLGKLDDEDGSDADDSVVDRFSSAGLGINPGVS